MFDSAAQALKFIQEKDIDSIDLKMVGVTGQWLHVTIPARHFTHSHFEAGVGYDGSSGSGFTRVESGDVAAIPEPDTAFLDPFWERPTLSFICRTVTADSRQPLPTDPRQVARQAVARLRETGIADEAWMAPEFEFHVFDRVEVVSEPYESRVRIVSGEVHGDGATPVIPTKQGYLRPPPADQLHDLRNEISQTLESLGVPVRYHHHEVGAPGQCEIEVAMDTLLRAADHAMLVKYVVKNVARRRGKLATFMPKPVFGEAGNGMHVHQRLTRGGKPLFYDPRPGRYADLSDVALQYVGGLLRHGRALAGITNPSTNSYKRLVEGYEAPVNLFFSLGNRSAAVRVPRYAVQPDEKRIEYRPPDFTGNVYLTLAAMLMAGIDGVQSRIDPAREGFGPHDVDIARQSAEFRSRITALPHSLSDALDALLADHAFLTAGDVFPDGFVQAWADTRRRNDSQAVRLRPHPHEFALYLDV